MVLGLLSALLACDARMTTALEDVAAGRRAPGDLRVVYHEERPLAGDVRVLVANGAVTVTSERVRPGCADPRSAACREAVDERRGLDPTVLRALAATLARARLERAPREDEPPPGAARLTLQVEVAGAGRAVAALDVAAADAQPPLRAVRAALLELAAPR